MNSKSWTIKSAEGKKFKFIPVFANTEGQDDIECKEIIIEVEDKAYKFNFVNLFQFIYFISNEELRQSLALRYQRRINKIPYDLSFKLDKEEIEKGFAKRRVELPVDEITMAIARNEAFKLMPGVLKTIGSGKNPQDLFKGRINR